MFAGLTCAGGLIVGINPVVLFTPCDWNNKANICVPCSGSRSSKITYELHMRDEVIHVFCTAVRKNNALKAEVDRFISTDSVCYTGFLRDQSRLDDLYERHAMGRPRLRVLSCISLPPPWVMGG